MAAAAGPTAENFWAQVFQFRDASAPDAQVLQLLQQLSSLSAADLGEVLCRLQTPRRDDEHRLRLLEVIRSVLASVLVAPCTHPEFKNPDFQFSAQAGLDPLSAAIQGMFLVDRGPIHGFYKMSQLEFWQQLQRFLMSFFRKGAALTRQGNSYFSSEEILGLVKPVQDSLAQLQGSQNFTQAMQFVMAGSNLQQLFKKLFSDLNLANTTGWPNSTRDGVKELDPILDFLISQMPPAPPQAVPVAANAHTGVPRSWTCLSTPTETKLRQILDFCGRNGGKLLIFFTAVLIGCFIGSLQLGVRSAQAFQRAQTGASLSREELMACCLRFLAFGRVSHVDGRAHPEGWRVFLFAFFLGLFVLVMIAKCHYMFCGVNRQRYDYGPATAEERQPLVRQPATIHNNPVFNPSPAERVPLMTDNSAYQSVDRGNDNGDELGHIYEYVE